MLANTALEEVRGAQLCAPISCVSCWTQLRQE